MNNLIIDNELIIIFKSGCCLFNENNIDDAHSKWELIWQKGSVNQKKRIKEYI